MLQPLLMGSAVKVHPLAVVLVVAGGALIAGIPGALFAVPLAAFVNVVVVYLGERAWETGRTARIRRSHLEHRPASEEDPPREHPVVDFELPRHAKASMSRRSRTSRMPRRRSQGVIARTPFDRSQHLSDVLGVPVHLKLENLQRTGSFKIRGADVPPLAR